MLRVAIRRVRPEGVDELREWFRAVNGERRQEALATLVDETCRHEQVHLVDGEDGPLLVLVMEVEDVEQSHKAVESSPHPIDAEHRAVMQRTVGGFVPTELLLDLHS